MGSGLRFQTCPLLVRPQDCYLDSGAGEEGRQAPSHPDNYLWESYHANAQGKQNPLIQPHPVYSGLGPDDRARQSAYRQLFRGALSKADLEAIREATNKGWVLGNERCRGTIEKLSGRRAGPKPRGRTRKVEIKLNQK